MEELNKAEERIMQVLWRLDKAFVKDIIERLPDDPKPPYNTISSIVRLLEKKGYVAHKAYGKTHEYFPLITKVTYRKAFFGRMMAGYFDNSLEAFLSFMVKQENLKEEDIEKIKGIIDRNSKSWSC